MSRHAEALVSRSPLQSSDNFNDTKDIADEPALHAACASPDRLWAQGAQAATRETSRSHICIAHSAAAPSAFESPDGDVEACAKPSAPKARLIKAFGAAPSDLKAVAAQQIHVEPWPNVGFGNCETPLAS